MFDEHVEKHDKKLDTLEDAVMLRIAAAFCNGTNCDECAAMMYGVACRASSQEVFDVLTKNGLYGLDAQKAFYEAIFHNSLVKKLNGAHKSEPEHQAISTCAHCANSVMHPSGIRWCNSFCNFVHEDGFCYKFEGVDSDV